MTKFLLITACVLAVLLVFCVLALFVQKKVYASKLKKQEQDFLKQWNELQEKQEEILKNAQKTKESLHTGSNDSDFSNSLYVLQNLAGGRKKDDSD